MAEHSTVRASKYDDEYDGRAGLLKLPYKMLFQQSEQRNKELLAEIKELKATIISLQDKVTLLEEESDDMRKGLLKQYAKEVKKGELYLNQQGVINHMGKEIGVLRQIKQELLARLLEHEKK